MAGEGREVAPRADNQAALLSRTFVASDGQPRSSDGTRSVCKQSGYFLADVDPRHRAGQIDDPHGWITYVHAYGNVDGGITIQYWRVYAYDQSKLLFVDFGHGGDWEGIAVHLDSTLQPGTGKNRPPTCSPAERLHHCSVASSPTANTWSEEGRAKVRPRTAIG